MYFFNSGRCKFNDQCAYLHYQPKNIVDVEISELESKIKEMGTKIKQIEILQLRLDQQDTQLKAFDSDNKKVKEYILTENKKQQSFSENETKLENLVQKFQELSENFYILLGSVDDLERTTKYLEHHFKMLSEQSQNFKCNLCGQLFQTEQTVNEHIRRHHGTKKP